MTESEFSLIPDGDADSFEYWENVQQGQLSALHCSDCSTWTFFPRLMCGNCDSREATIRPLAGRGVIYSYTIVYRTASEHWSSVVPYVVGLIDLVEGPRMLADIRSPVENVAVGKEVFVTFGDEHGGLPGFIVDVE